MNAITSGWASKPPPGTEINWDGPLAPGLQLFVPCNEGTGTASDIVQGSGNGLNLTLNGGATWSSASMGGILVTAAGRNATALVPPFLKFGWPITIAVAFRVVAMPATSATFWGIVFSSAGASPFNAIQVCYTPNYGCNYNSAGVQKQLTSSTAAIVGSDVVLSATITPAFQNLYLNGNLIASATTTPSNPNYSTTSEFIFGYPTSLNPNSLSYWGGLWQGAFDATWHALIGSNIYAAYNGVMQPPNSWLLKRSTVTESLFRRGPMTGLGVGGPFFSDPMSVI